ncbi:MAG: DNA polymerase III subunit delta [Brevinema sp.]
MVVLVGGENPILIWEEIHKIVHTFPEEDRVIYYGDELVIEEFFVDLRTGSLFSNNRMILVKNVNKTKSEFEKSLLSYLNDPSDSVCLILEYQKIPSKVLNAVSNLGNQQAVIHNFKKAWAQDQKRYAQRRLSDQGITCSNEAIDLLITFAGEDIEEVSGMLDRLIAYAGSDKKTLTEKDLYHVLERAKNASIFDLIEAIFAHNRAVALQALQDLLYAGESFPAITAMFYRSVKIMWAVKTANQGEIPEGFAVSPYEWKKYQGLASKNNLRFLSSCFECIQTMEWESKTKADFFTQLTFEKFLCGL